MNETLQLIERRSSTRSYDPAALDDDDKQTILHAAMRAPTAGNLMLYSIVEVADQALKDRLAMTCDDQPFIARAPWLLLFVADWQKWMDLFAAAGVDSLDPSLAPPGITPGPGHLMDAVCDALIAAQTAVIAAESLGIGSCYIGDILELGETHADLFDLPRYTFPITLVCFGRPRAARRPTPHFERHVVHRDRYRRLSTDELREASDELDAFHGVRSARSGIANVAQDVYARKFSADFALEANRSVAWWLARWQEPDGAPGADRAVAPSG